MVFNTIPGVQLPRFYSSKWVFKLYGILFSSNNSGDGAAAELPDDSIVVIERDYNSVCLFLLFNLEIFRINQTQ